MTYSLFELNEFIRRVLALNLSEAVWVRCELAQVNISRGHCYLEMVEKSESGGEIIAQGSGIIWSSRLKKLKRKLGRESTALLQEGMQVLLQVKVDFNERYGLKLMVEDIDPAYTLGKMELQKQATLKALQAEGLLEKNGSLELPLVVQRLAVISSETAAGLQDFLEQLSNNPYGYYFRTVLFPSAMQGGNVSKELCSQLKNIESQQHKFDAVIIIRGGGAKLDLAAFDDLEIGRAVANVTLPVLVGIGHETDETILDLVANTSLKTPTAVAEFVVQKAMVFESGILEMKNAVSYFAEQKIQVEKERLGQTIQGVQSDARTKLRREEMMLEFINKEIPLHFNRRLKDEQHTLESLATAVELLRPETAFRRGFSLTSKNGKIITSSQQVKAGDEITTQFKKGEIKSTVKK